MKTPQTISYFIFIFCTFDLSFFFCLQPIQERWPQKTIAFRDSSLSLSHILLSIFIISSFAMLMTSPIVSFLSLSLHRIVTKSLIHSLNLLAKCKRTSHFQIEFMCLSMWKVIRLYALLCYGWLDGYSSMVCSFPMTFLSFCSTLFHLHYYTLISVHLIEQCWNDRNG